MLGAETSPIDASVPPDSNRPGGLGGPNLHFGKLAETLGSQSLAFSGPAFLHDLHRLEEFKLWPSQVLRFDTIYIALGGPKFGPLTSCIF